eukprot:462290_1
MGNTVSEQKCIGSGKLKVKEYPTDVKEDEWIPIIDFEAKDQQNQEVLITENVDRRIRAKPEDYNGFDFDEKKIDINNEYEYKNPIYNIVQLRMERSVWPKTTIGSGVIIHHSMNRAYVLTAAHNIVRFEEDENNSDKMLNYAESIWIQINKNTVNNGYEMMKKI